MKDFQYITSQHPAYIESLYQDFVQNPASVDPELKKFFEGFDFAISTVGGIGNRQKAMGNGQGSKEARGKEARGNGQGAMVNGQWAVGNGQ